jgi:hypothetical protein
MTRSMFGPGVPESRKTAPRKSAQVWGFMDRTG